MITFYHYFIYYHIFNLTFFEASCVNFKLRHVQALMPF